MAKRRVVQARLDPDLKRQATKVLLDQEITWQRWIEQQVIALVQRADRRTEAAAKSRPRR
jgi:antitoxin component of RelBE/YafQ-DinJ toxin-antitoxin module